MSSTEEQAVKVMDDEMATRPDVPDVSRPSQAREHAGGLAKIQRTIIRHRLDEFTALAAMGSKILGDIISVAGAENGMATAARARIKDLDTLVGMVAEHRKDVSQADGDGAP